MQHDEDEWVEDADNDEESSQDLLVCPSCHHPVHEETQQCPHCGDWITPVWPRHPFRRVAVILLVVILAGSIVLLAVF